MIFSTQKFRMLLDWTPSRIHLTFPRTPHVMKIRSFWPFRPKYFILVCTFNESREAILILSCNLLFFTSSFKSELEYSLSLSNLVESRPGGNEAKSSQFWRICSWEEQPLLHLRYSYCSSPPALISNVDLSTNPNFKYNSQITGWSCLCMAPSFFLQQHS